jgi:hypothetical protein
MRPRRDTRALAEAARDEAANLVRLVCAQHIGEGVKEHISRTAQWLSWSYSRTEDIWRREARRIDSWEMDILRASCRGIRKGKATVRRR